MGTLATTTRYKWFYSVEEVMNGNAHAFGSSEPKPSLWTLANPDILFKPFGDERFNFLPGGFAVRQGDPDFLTFQSSGSR